MILYENRDDADEFPKKFAEENHIKTGPRKICLFTFLFYVSKRKKHTTRPNESGIRNGLYSKFPRGLTPSIKRRACGHWTAARKSVTVVGQQWAPFGTTGRSSEVRVFDGGSTVWIIHTSDSLEKRSGFMEDL